MGLISLFNRLAKGQEQSSETSTTSEQQTTYQRHNQRQNRHDNRTRTTRELEKVDADSLDLDEQRERQMEKLAGRMNASLDPEEELEDLPQTPTPKKNVATSQDHDKKLIDEVQMKSRVKQRLTTKQGLIDSIVMAEVLGRPRALEPYSNVLTRRKEK